MLLVACLFTVCLFIFIRFTDCLFNLPALSLAFGYFFMPKVKGNVKFYLRNQESVFNINYFLLFKTHSVFLKMCMVNLQRRKEMSPWHHYMQPVLQQTSLISLSFLPSITIKTEFCYQVESETVTIWWENKKEIFPGDGSAALVKKKKNNFYIRQTWGIWRHTLFMFSSAYFQQKIELNNIMTCAVLPLCWGFVNLTTLKL